jgi:hypothetical protein
MRLGKRPRWVTIHWEPRDCWIGVYWTWKATGYHTAYGLVRWEWHLYVCLVPCLPIHLIWGQVEREDAP